LDAFTARYPTQFAASAQQIFKELSGLINDTDNNKAALSLEVCANILEKITTNGSQSTVAAATKFAGSELIGTGQSLLSLQRFFKIAAAKGIVTAADCEILIKNTTI
jgi:hypothetical protein